MKMKLTRLIALALSGVAMCLPYGAVLRFVTQSEGGVSHETLKTYSYFDPTIFGYANFAPFICAILTAVLLFALVLEFMGVNGKPIRVGVCVLSGVAALFSVLPLVLYGVQFYNTTAMMITYLLASAFVMSILLLKMKPEIEITES